MFLDVVDVNLVVDGVYQPQECRMCKPFVYSWKNLLMMKGLWEEIPEQNHTSEGTERGETHKGGQSSCKDIG